MLATSKKTYKRQRLNVKLRKQFLPFYADHNQQLKTNFWPSVGLMATKKQIATKPMPPVGMNLVDITAPLVEWREPVDAVGLHDWIEKACHANSDLMISEFNQENSIRYRLTDSDFDVYLHTAGDILPVKASIFFGANVLRFCSWSFYCKLLMYMHENGFNLNLIEGAVDWSKRSHLLVFMSSQLPLSYLLRFSHQLVQDKDILVGKLIDCMDMFVAVRTALFGVGRLDAMDPTRYFIREMIINTDSNAVVRLNETLRLSMTAVFICNLPLSEQVARMFESVWDDHLDPRVLMDMLGFSRRVPLLRSFDEERKRLASGQPSSRNFNVINIKEEHFLRGVRNMLLQVFGDRPWWDVSFTIRDDRDLLDIAELQRLSLAICLLQLAYGSRYVGVLLFNKVKPVANYLEQNDLEPSDYSPFDEDVKNVLKLQNDHDARIVVTNLSKQKKDLSGRCLITKIFDAQSVMGDMLEYTSAHMRSRSLPSNVPVIIFFKLLRAVRHAVSRIFVDVDIVWDNYDAALHDYLVANIDYIERRDEDTLFIRKMKSLLYASVNEAAKTIAIDGMPNITTHDLRRLYGAYAYYLYGNPETIVKTEFIRASFSHDGDAARFYTGINITE